MLKIGITKDRINLYNSYLNDYGAHLIPASPIFELFFRILDARGDLPSSYGDRAIYD